ncbi:hypothetical protein TWF696_008385 [Orbilia brochopaga]|uniref:Uncharacterized protein n=1 Tax=Orbilia brochopaga TaxID=3140254 RepID=A0AAV9UJN1_9PEZI
MDATDAPEIDGAYTSSTARKGKLRLKSHRRSHRDEREPDHRRRRSASPTPHESTSDNPRKRKQPRQPTVAETDDPSLYDDVYLPGQNSFKYKDPEAAFNESLFEAMADDEGAAYWEGVYGQPIHVYHRPKVENAKGELEAMTDEEYAAYVRQRMYEKTQEYLEEERQKHEQVRKRVAEQRKREAEERAEWRRKEKTLIAREQERRQSNPAQRMCRAWTAYTRAWEDATRKDVLDRQRLDILWPVESGLRKDVSEEAVEKFIKSAAGMLQMNRGTSDGRSYAEILRAERVRWHPDRALQRWGRELVTSDLLKGMTAVFQIIDSLWAKERDRILKRGTVAVDSRMSTS